MGGVGTEYDDDYVPFYYQPYRLVRRGAFAAGTYDDTGW